MAQAVQVFKDNAIRVKALEEEQAALEAKALADKKAAMAALAVENWNLGQFASPDLDAEPNFL
jgi:hypothetical protein